MSLTHYPIKGAAIQMEQHWLLCSLLPIPAFAIPPFISSNYWHWSQKAFHFRLLCTRVPLLHHHHLKPFLLQFCIVFQSLLGIRANLTKIRVTKPPHGFKYSANYPWNAFVASVYRQWEKSERTPHPMLVTVLTHSAQYTVHTELWHKPWWELFLLAYQYIFKCSSWTSVEAVTCFL